MAGEEHIMSGTTAVKSDTRRLLLIKILNATLTGGGGGLAGAGLPTVIYPTGPIGGHEGTPYVNTLTGQISWWYSGQWNP